MKIVSRKQWGAKPPRSRSLVNWPEGVTLWVHHTAGPPTQTPAQIQAFHMGPSRGWSDIGYGYLIDEAGTIYEGRGFEVNAAHSPGKNHEPSVALIGTYTSTEPTDAQRASVWALADFLNAGRLRGHRQNTGGTTCPGDGTMRKIVNAPRPSAPVPDPDLYYFEEMPHDQGGNGPKIVGNSTGYASLARAQAIRLTQIMLGRSTSILSADDGRHYVLWWKSGTHGLRFRWGPWREADDRDDVAVERAQNTGRKIRRFNGRERSLYPWPKAT